MARRKPTVRSIHSSPARAKELLDCQEMREMEIAIANSITASIKLYFQYITLAYGSPEAVAMAVETKGKMLDSIKDRIKRKIGGKVTAGEVVTFDCLFRELNSVGRNQLGLHVDSR